MKKIILIPFLFFVLSASAQQRMFYLNWDITKPASNTGWMNNASAAGGKAGYRKFMERSENKFSTGLDFGWTTYSQYKPAETFQQENGAITTDYFNYVFQYTLTGSVQYNFIAHENFYVYGGLGLGAMYNKYRVYYNIWVEGNESWGFLARPEAGVIARIPGRSIGGMAALHYDIATNKSEGYGYNNFSAIGFQIGIVLMTRY